jgi:hypothetical protein
MQRAATAQWSLFYRKELHTPSLYHNYLSLDTINCLLLPAIEADYLIRLSAFIYKWPMQLLQTPDGLDNPAVARRNNGQSRQIGLAAQVTLTSVSFYAVFPQFLSFHISIFRMF